MNFWFICAPCPFPQLSWITKDTLPIGTYTVQIQSVMSGGASQCLYGWPAGNGMFAMSPLLPLGSECHACS